MSRVQAWPLVAMRGVARGGLLVRGPLYSLANLLAVVHLLLGKLLLCELLLGELLLGKLLLCELLLVGQLDCRVVDRRGREGWWSVRHKWRWLSLAWRQHMWGHTPHRRVLHSQSCRATHNLQQLLRHKR